MVQNLSSTAYQRQPVSFKHTPQNNNVAAFASNAGKTNPAALKLNADVALDNSVVNQVPVAKDLKNQDNPVVASLPLFGLWFGPKLGNLLSTMSGYSVQVAENGAKTASPNAMINMARSLDKYSEPVENFLRNTKITNMIDGAKSLIGRVIPKQGMESLTTAFAEEVGVKAAAQKVQREVAEKIASLNTNVAESFVAASQKRPANTNKEVLTSISEKLTQVASANTDDALKLLSEIAETAQNSGVRELKQVAKQARNAGKTMAKESLRSSSAQRTLDTLKAVAGEAVQLSDDVIVQQAKPMGMLGKTAAKSGLFLKQQLTGLTGMMNSVFAMFTIVNTIKAKPGEKLSTFMEDVLGTWVGSMGGFALANAGMKGMLNAAKANSPGIIGKAGQLLTKLPLPGKQFILPLVASIVLCNQMTKVSHAIFGKPTKDEDKKSETQQNEAQATNPSQANQTSNNAVSFASEGKGIDGWLNKTGWENQPAAASLNQSTQSDNPAALGLGGNNEPEYVPVKHLPNASSKAQNMASSLLSQTDSVLEMLDVPNLHA